MLVNCFDHVIKSCYSSLSLFALEDKETEKLDTSLSFVQHGVAVMRGSWRIVLKMFTTLFRFRKVKAARKG